MKTVDLAVAWNWEYDEDFVRGICRECEKVGLSIYEVQPRNLSETIDSLQRQELSVRVFYDRASDADEAFLPLVSLLQRGSVRVINPHGLMKYAIDKATMHLELMAHGLYVPHTIILPSYNQKKEIELVSSELERIGKPFVVKPANTTGGGTGVVLNAMMVQDIADARQEHRDDKYLLQEKVHPKDLDGRRGWFRAYYAFGEIIPCWWDDLTHRYSELSYEQEDRFGLLPLRNAMQVIEHICKLDFFSSEIVQTGDGGFVVVDYVNEICDMRLQSKYGNGAPDAVVKRIQQLIVREVMREVGQSAEVIPAGKNPG